MEKNKIAIVIPAFNEEKTIISILNKVKNYGVPIVIDDGSNDKTKELIEKNKFKFQSNLKNMGYNYSLIKGIKYAYFKKYKYIINFDADGQHKVSDLKKIIRYLKKNDLVYTVRNKYGRISEYLFSFLARSIYKIQDPLSGLKGYRSTIFNNYKFTFEHQLLGSDILINSLNKNFKIKFFKIIVNNRKDNSRIGNSFYANIVVIKSCFYLIKNFFIKK